MYYLRIWIWSNWYSSGINR